MARKPVTQDRTRDAAAWLVEHRRRVEAWTDASLRARRGAASDLAARWESLLLSFLEMPPQLIQHSSDLRADLRRWQSAVIALDEAVESSEQPTEESHEDPGARATPKLLHIATATTDALKARIDRGRMVSGVAAALLVVCAVGWVFAVAASSGTDLAAAVTLFTVVGATVLACIAAAFWRSRWVSIAVVAVPLALVGPAVVALFDPDRAVWWWALVLLVAGLALGACSVLWYAVLAPGRTVAPTSIRSFATTVPLRWPDTSSSDADEADELEGSAAALVPSTGSTRSTDPAEAVEVVEVVEVVERAPAVGAGDLPVVSALLDDLDAEIAATQMRRTRAWRSWQFVQVALSSAAALASGVAGVAFVNAGQPGDSDFTGGAGTPLTWPALVAAAAAALSGLVAALNPGRRQEENRLAVLGCSALRRELRILREHDLRHDPAVRSAVRDALEDVTIRFEAVVGGPEQQSYWRRKNPVGLEAAHG